MNEGINLTPLLEDATLMSLVDKTPSFRKLSLPFNCLNYGKHFRCLTDMIVMGKLGTKQARVLFDKLQKLGTLSETFLLLDHNSAL